MTSYDGLEKAAREKFAQGIPCTPKDLLFAEGDQVVEAKTPQLFVGSKLCDRINIVKYIESGAFGRGWVATDDLAAEPSKHIFVKTFRAAADRPNTQDPATHEKMIKKEIEVLFQSADHRIPEHPNLVNGVRVLYGSVFVPKTGQKGEMFFVLSPDLCEGGELYNFLVFGSGIKKFSEKIARFCFKQIAEGVAHMHKHGLFHRDLKLENIVIDSHYNCKIMDFGHAKHASECEVVVDQLSGDIEYKCLTFVGTSSYQPPELKQGSAFYNPAAFDVWSLGVILFFLVGIEGLAAKGNDFTFISKVKQRQKGYDFLDQVRGQDDVPDNAKFWEHFGSSLKFSPELKHLLNGIFDLNSKKRFTMEKILKHKWLQGEMPTHEELVAALSGRSTGIVDRDLLISLAERCVDQTAALAAMEKAVRVIAPYTKHGHKLGVCNPPKFAVAVGENRKVRVMWLTGGLDEWLEFRHLLLDELKISEDMLLKA